MDQVNFLFVLDNSGAAPELCLMHACSNDMYTVYSFDPAQSDWASMFVTQGGLDAHYTVFSDIACDRSHGAFELVALRSHILTMVTEPASDLNMVYWRALFLVWQSVIFDADQGVFRNSRPAGTLDAFERSVFQISSLFTNLKALNLSKSAIDAFVKSPLAPALPTWESLRGFFLDAPDNIGAGTPGLDAYASDIPLFHGSNEVVASQSVANIYSLIARAKSNGLCAWPGQEATTASVGGGLLHLGLSLATLDEANPSILELRRNFSASVSPLQLCLLNALLQKLQGDGGNADGDFELVFEEGQQISIAALPYVFGPDAVHQYKCVDDASTFRVGEAHVSLELKTRWADGWHSPRQMREHYWQSAIQSLAVTLHQPERYYPSIAIIRIPRQDKISSVQIHFTRPLSNNENVHGDILRQFLIEASHLNSERDASNQMVFCNGRIFSSSNTVNSGVFKLFQPNDSAVLPRTLRVRSYRFPLVRSGGGEDDGPVASSHGIGFAAGPVGLNTALNTYDVKVYKEGKTLTFQHRSPTTGPLKPSVDFHRKFKGVFEDTVRKFNLVFVRGAARAVGMSLSDGTGTTSDTNVSLAFRPFLQGKTLSYERFKSIVLPTAAPANTPTQGITALARELQQRFVTQEVPPTFLSNLIDNSPQDILDGI